MTEREDVTAFMAETSSELRHIRSELTKMGRVLETLVTLDRRLIRIEEGRDSMTDSLRRAFERLERVEDEIDKWRTFRRIGGWILTLSVALLSVLLGRLLNGA